MARGAGMVRSIDLMRCGHRTLLDGIRTTIAAGDTVALIGPLGAGKSTLIRIRAGMEQRVRGQALITGQLLLLDGPFGSLYRVVARDLRGLVVDLIARGPTTAVLVSRDCGDARGLAHRVILIFGRKVRILADLVPDAVPTLRIRNPVLPFESSPKTTLLEVAP